MHYSSVINFIFLTPNVSNLFLFSVQQKSDQNGIGIKRTMEHVQSQSIALQFLHFHLP